jgi:hypothetical protein
MATPLSRVSQLGQRQRQQQRSEDGRFGKGLAQTPGLQTLLGKARFVPPVEEIKEATGGDRKRVELLFGMRQQFTGSGVIDLI